MEFQMLLQSEFIMFNLLYFAFFLIVLIPVLYFFVKMVRRRREIGMGSYVAYDTSILKRIVRDPSSGQEQILSGSGNDTYRGLCRKNWRFDFIAIDEPWIVTDDRGNDISDNPIASYDGLAEIALPIGYERKDRKGEDDLDGAITYYD